MAKKSLKQLDSTQLEAIAQRFKALGEPSRLALIQALQGGEKNVSELVEITGLSQPNVSRHLSLLVAAGLLGKRKDGLNVLYRIVDRYLESICSAVCKSIT